MMWDERKRVGSGGSLLVRSGVYETTGGDEDTDSSSCASIFLRIPLTRPPSVKFNTITEDPPEIVTDRQDLKGLGE